MTRTETYLNLLRQLETDNSVLYSNYVKGKISNEKYSREADKNRLDTLTRILNMEK